MNINNEICFKKNEKIITLQIKFYTSNEYE